MHKTQIDLPYIGRFAPSPSGPLHFGSLVTALASYLDAKHHHGQWLVRMEDIDPPREIDGAQEIILSSLLAHGLQWDGDVMRQSERLTTYQRVLEQLSPYCYSCFCNRQRLNTLNGIYDGHCLHHGKTEKEQTDNRNVTKKSEHLHTPKSSTRLRTDIFDNKKEQITSIETFNDLFQQQQKQPLQTHSGDFVLRRKDGLFAYQLAVTIDDIDQGITHIIRGADLLSTTSRQRYLWTILQSEPSISGNINNHRPLPEYGHIPVASTPTGQKLSKQNQAAALNNTSAFENLCQAFTFLHHSVPNHISSKADIQLLLAWGIQNWDRAKIPKETSIIAEQ